MPPHGHHGHGHGNRGGYGHPRGGGVYPFFAGGYDLTPSTDVTIINQPDALSQKQILAFIASLPAKDRAAAYAKLFSPQAASGFDLGTLATPKSLAVIALLGLSLWFVSRRPKSNPARRRRRR